MKKGLRWIISGLVLASTFTVAACGGDEVEEHKHTYAATWTSNEAGHWYAATCEHTDQMANMATHEDEDNDGVCDVCEYGSDHVHTYEEGWTSDETNHWYAVSCGHSVEVKDKAAHVDEGNDGACDVCGFDNGHIHTWNKAEWTNDTAYHWHSVTCGHTIDVADKEAHTDANDDGICDICEGQTFEAGHTHVYDETKWENNTTHHWYASTCHTGLKKNETKHTDADKDGVCEVCEGKTYDEADHTHTYASTWSINDTHHWQEGNCGHPGLKNNYAAHEDTNKDGACDTCGRTDHTHTYSSVWTTDENKHWHDAACGCALKILEENHVDVDDDGVCDVCAYEDTAHFHNMVQKYDDNNHWMECKDHAGVVADIEAHVDENDDGVCDGCEWKDFDNTHTHTYADTYSYDMNNHWFAGNCGHTGLMDSVAAHVDLTTPATEGEGTVDGADGYCDDCGAETFDSVIARASSEAAQAVVKKGFVSVNDYASEEFYFEYGPADYFHVLGLASDGFEYWYMKEGNGVFALYDTGSGELSVPYGATVDNVKGYEIELSYNEVAYGVSDAIALFYEFAVANGNVEVAYVDGVYSFKGVNANGQDFTVSFVIDEEAVYDSDWNFVGYVQYVSWFQLVIDDYYGTTYEVTQIAGARTAVSPYQAADYIPASFTIEDNEGNTVEDGATIQMTMGESLSWNLVNVAPTTANFNFDNFTATCVDSEGQEAEGMINAYLQSDAEMGTNWLDISHGYSPVAGTYTVTMSWLKVEYTFTFVLSAPEVTSISAQVYDDTYYSYVDASTANIFVGETIDFVAGVNQYANKAYTASITSENAATATLTNEDNDYYYKKYYFTATAAGEYVVTLVSAENNEITATLTITVSEPPQPSDVLNGSYSYSDYYGSGYTVYVTFTPASEGAVTGTAQIALVDRNDVATIYNVNYAYDETNGLVVTKDGSAFEDVVLAYENYELTAQWLYEGWWGPEMTDAYVLVVSAPYIPPTAEDMVAGTYRYEVIGANGWSLESATDIVLNADGTGTYTRWHFDENYDQVVDAEASFTWTVVDNGNGTYSVTVVLAEGATAELAAGTWTVGVVSGTDNWGYPTTYTAITGVMVNGTATEFPFYE